MLSERGPITILVNDGMGMVYNENVTAEVVQLEQRIEDLEEIRDAVGALPALSAPYLGIDGIEIPEITGIPTENYDALIELIHPLAQQEEA